MTREYRYDYHRISVAIFEWAESQIARPDSPREYFNKQLKWGLDEIQKLEFQEWLPVYETYKGRSQKHKGKAYVAVRMPNGQDYGFLYTLEWAGKIHQLLHDLWMGWINGRLPAEIASAAEQR